MLPQTRNLVKSRLPPIVEALLKPQAYPHKPQEIKLVQTQMSFLFLTGDYVYKVKKPVDLGYLDYTTLEKRRFFCHQELELNRRLCPDVYLAVVPITMSLRGAKRRGNLLYLEGEGKAMEYAVKMRQLPQNRMMDVLLAQGKVTKDMIARVAEKLAHFHQKAATNPEIASFGNLSVVRQNCDESFAQTEKYIGVSISRLFKNVVRGFSLVHDPKGSYYENFGGEGLPKCPKLNGETKLNSLISSRRYNRIKSYTKNFINSNSSLFCKRVREDKIRDCHGDLHTAHVCFTNDICIYDCIEFNDRFRYCDVASELAFLAMDLDRYQQADLSQHLVNTYVGLSQDKELLNLLNFYKCYRAYVRGKVESFKLDDPYISEEEKTTVLAVAQRYFELAESYV